MGSVSGYRGLVGPSKPGSELASRHVRSIASGLGNTTNNCPVTLLSTNSELLIDIQFRRLALKSPPTRAQVG